MAVAAPARPPAASQARRSARRISGVKKYSEAYWLERDHVGRCVGTALRRDTGEPGRCLKAAIAGGAVCPTHGGATGHIKAAAKRRVERDTALRYAEAELDRLGLPDRDPLEHLEAALDESARLYALADLECRWKVDRGETLTSTDRHGALVEDPAVSNRRLCLTQWTRAAKQALDAGVAQKRVAIAHREGELFATAWTAVIERARAQGLAEGLAAQLGPWLAQELQRAQAKQLPRGT